jgi:hypothetical protein
MIAGACLMLTVLTFFVIRQIIITIDLANSPPAFYDDPVVQPELLLADFPVYKQTYANSCGPTTISMVYSYLVKPISELEIADKMGFSLGRSGMLPAQFSERLESVLMEYEYQVKHQVNISDDIFVEQVYLKLKQGIPVPIYFSTVNQWGKPNYDSHYSVIIGLRPQKHEVVIANAYGFLEEMPISDLLHAVKYENYRNPPFDFRLGLFVGIINRNNMFLIQQCSSC